MNNTNDTNSKNKRSGKSVGIVATIILVIAAVFLIPDTNKTSEINNIEENANSTLSTQKSPSPASQETLSKDYEDAISDACLVKAALYAPKDVDVSTISGLLDSDFNRMGENKEGNPMYIYRWDGSNNGNAVNFYCFAALRSDGSVNVATIDMGSGNHIYQDDRYDYAD